MVINRDRQKPLGAFLADDVLAQHVEDFARFGQAAQRADGQIVVFDDFGAALFGEDAVAQLDTFVANINARTRDQVGNLFAALATERAPQIVAVFAKHCHISISLFQLKRLADSDESRARACRFAPVNSRFERAAHAFDFGGELGFVGQCLAVARGHNLVVQVAQRVTRDGFVLIGAQD